MNIENVDQHIRITLRDFPLNDRALLNQQNRRKVNMALKAFAIASFLAVSVIYVFFLRYVPIEYNAFVLGVFLSVMAFAVIFSFFLLEQFIEDGEERLSELKHKSKKDKIDTVCKYNHQTNAIFKSMPKTYGTYLYLNIHAQYEAIEHIVCK